MAFQRARDTCVTFGVPCHHLGRVGSRYSRVLSVLAPGARRCLCAVRASAARMAGLADVEPKQPDLYERVYRVILNRDWLVIVLFLGRIWIDFPRILSLGHSQ